MNCFGVLQPPWTQKSQDCPCCTRRTVLGMATWKDLCDPCAWFAFRLGSLSARATAGGGVKLWRSFMQFLCGLDGHRYPVVCKGRAICPRCDYEHARVRSS